MVRRLPDWPSPTMPPLYVCSALCADFVGEDTSLHDLPYTTLDPLAPKPVEGAAPLPAPLASISAIVLSEHSHNAFNGSAQISPIVSFDNEACLSRHDRYVDIGVAQAFFNSDKCGTLK